MNQLKMKAKAGVTLVELLVVILIVTILSVSMLPLLKPFVVEAQYAAEAIPVIGNLRTKIGLFQYDKGKLPAVWGGTSYADTIQIETWIPSADGTSIAAEDQYSSVDKYVKGVSAFGSDKPYPEVSLYARDENEDSKIGHLGILGDIDYQDLKGKRSRPNDYQYLVMKNGSDYMYLIGCFGDGNGLPKGTGYAVCEIVMKNHKYVGTWKRYKPVSDPDATDDVQLCFTSNAEHPDSMEDKDTFGCYVPTKTEIDQATSANGKLDIIAKMVQYGWEF